MKRKFTLYIFFCIDITLLIFVLLYKIYLITFEVDFYEINLKNIESVENEVNRKKSISFVVVGNIKNSIGIFDKQLIDRINLDNPDMVVSVGNAVADGAEDKYRILYRSLGKLRSPVILCIGDNEVSDKGKLRFYNHFGPFYFSFALGNVYFLFLDTTGETFELWQREWLVKTLQDAQRYAYRFIFMNKPPYRVRETSLFPSKKKYIADALERRFLLDAFARQHVTAVFSSNVEIFAKRTIGGVPYYITGGGGGGLILHDQRSFYHYIRVSVTPAGVSYHVVKLGKTSRSASAKLMENFWLYIHSFFYISFIDFLLCLSLIGLAGMVIFIKATKQVNYYPDCNTIPQNISPATKLTIAMFTNAYLPFVGGVPISIARLAQGLRKLGHEVYVFAPTYPEDPSLDDDLTIRCKLLFYYNDYPVVNIFSSDIEKCFASLNIDIVHVHHPYWMGSKGLKLARKYDVPVVFTYHTRLEKYAHHIPFIGPLFQNGIPHCIIRKFAQKCDAVFAPTRTAKAYLRNIGVSRSVVVLPTGVDFASYRNLETREQQMLREKFGVTDGIILLSVSRLAKEKNLEFLLEGIRYIKEHTEIDFKCIVVGDGPEKENILRLIESGVLRDVVYLVGPLEQQEMSKYYMASDIFVFASQSETQGMVLLEAMAGGCPVVAVRSGGIEDMIQDGRNGFKTVADVRVWAEKVMDLMRHREVAGRMSECACTFSHQFSIEVMAAKAARLYLRLVRTSNHPSWS
jgi:glycosyltransferase involved in cell wall biosynthesis